VDGSPRLLHSPRMTRKMRRERFSRMIRRILKLDGEAWLWIALVVGSALLTIGYALNLWALIRYHAPLVHAHLDS
jgi:hypothetical protein